MSQAVTIESISPSAWPLVTEKIVHSSARVLGAGIYKGAPALFVLNPLADPDLNESLTLQVWFVETGQTWNAPGQTLYAGSAEVRFTAEVDPTPGTPHSSLTFHVFYRLIRLGQALTSDSLVFADGSEAVPDGTRPHA